MDPCVDCYPCFYCSSNWGCLREKLRLNMMLMRDFLFSKSKFSVKRSLISVKS